MKRKSKYSLMAAALISATCLCGPTDAQTSNAGSISNSNSLSNATGIGLGGQGGTAGAVSGSASRSNSISQGGSAQGSGTSNATITFNDPGVPATTTENLTGTQRLVTVGTAIAPSIYSNNVCALSAAAAGGFLGGAFSLGFDRVDKGCDIRANVALLGHFAEIYRSAASQSVDPGFRQRAEHMAAIYAQWANNLLCMSSDEFAKSMPPGSNFCQQIATQQGMEVVPAPVPVTYAPPPAPVMAQPVVPPQKPVQVAGPHVYGTYEAVPSSHHTGPISGYDGPDYQDD